MMTVLSTANIVIIGDRAVGKTSIARMMSAGQQTHTHNPTACKAVFHLSLLLDLQLVEGKLIDLPTIETFPMDRQEEWKKHRHSSLLGADIYLMVFDLTKQSSFNYIKKIREKIIRAR